MNRAGTGTDDYVPAVSGGAAGFLAAAAFLYFAYIGAYAPALVALGLVVALGALAMTLNHRRWCR